MAPTGQPGVDVTRISDAELSQMLKDYGVDVGPINVATRRTYERKLIQLQAGTAMPSKQNYPPVDDDDDEEEEVAARWSEAKIRTSPLLSESSQPRVRQVRDTQPYPHLESKFLQSSEKRTPLNFSTPAKRPVPRCEEESKAIPVWLILAAVGIVVTLLYLIYINMEAWPQSSLPGIQQKTEV